MTTSSKDFSPLIRVLTYLRAFWVSCFSSLKKAILNWCLTNSSWEQTKNQSVRVRDGV